MKQRLYKIIIADDNATFLEGLQILLSKYENFKVVETCSNGQELVDARYLSEADLIISDIEMPEINGLNAAAKVNYLYPNIPMIAVSMHQEKVYLQDIVSAGFKGFVYKPDVSQMLVEVIEQVLSNNYVFPNNIK